MLQGIRQLAGRTVLDRAVLFANHVLRAEPAATERLKAHAGRTVLVELGQWPSFLPAPGPTALRITPAGMVERAEEFSSVDLSATVDASNPAALAGRWMSGNRPAVALVGDPALADDVRWLLANLRWDVREDLSRVIGDAPAETLARAGTAVRDAANRLADRASGWTGKRP
jgi:ubiquinone biosynthesis protein UbiJ